MSLVRTVAPTAYPIDVSDVRAHSRVSTVGEDSYIEEVIAAATAFIEGYLDQTLITSTYVLRLPRFCSEIYLPRSPVSSVPSVEYTDTAGATQTLSTSIYEADTYVNPGRIRLKYGQSWPQVREQENAVIVTYVAGYGATKTSVPADLRQAVRVIAAHMYEHREHVVTGTIASELPTHVMDWLSQHRNVGFG